MNMHRVFARKVAGGVVWATDTLPQDSAGAQVAPPTTLDCGMSFMRYTDTGWPVHRVAVGYSGPVGAPNLQAQLFVFDKTSNLYFATGASSTLTLGQISFFPVVSIGDAPQTRTNGDKQINGGVDVVLIVTPSGSVNGTYTFAMGPDLISN